MTELVRRCYRLQYIIDECIERSKQPVETEFKGTSRAKEKPRRRGKAAQAPVDAPPKLPTGTLDRCNIFLDRFIHTIEQVPVFKKKLTENNPVQTSIKTAIDGFLVSLPESKDGNSIARLVRNLLTTFCEQLSVAIGLEVNATVMTFENLGKRLQAYAKWAKENAKLKTAKEQWYNYLIGIFCFSGGVLSMVIYSNLPLFPYVLPSLAGCSFCPWAARELYYGASFKKLEEQFVRELGAITSNESLGGSTHGARSN